MTIECKQQFKAYGDAGHGWVAVKLWMLKQLGIAEEITSYSYHRGQTVYLEEDKDAHTFAIAYKEKTGHFPVYKEGKHVDRSPIRSYPRYVAPKPTKDTK